MSESRIETLLNALINGEKIDFTPRSRAEQYLKNCIEGCGCDGLPAPKSRLDALLYSLADKIAQGGGGGGSDIDALIDGSITEISSNAESVMGSKLSGLPQLKSVNLPNATSIGNSAFYNCSALKSVNLPNATSIGNSAFYNCSALKSVNLPNATSIGNNAFEKCSALKSVNLPNATSIGKYAFNVCTALESVNLPNATSINDYALRVCEILASIDLPNATSIGNNAFDSCCSLKVIILRSETMCTLSNTNALNQCHHILGTTHSKYNPNGDKDGYFYVPRALVDTYKAATNWTTYATQFRALEDYTVDGTITGELDPNKI